MRKAVRSEEGLLAPTVGTWRPAIGVGAPLSEGLLLGWLHRAGRPVEVVAPKGAAGVATSVVASGTWCAYGDALVTSGVGTVGGVAKAAPVASDRPEGVEAICADIDGTVFLRPEPGAATFVQEGQAIEARSTVALVEVMKTFTPVRAPAAGTVVSVRVDDGDAVEVGDALFWIRPG